MKQPLIFLVMISIVLSACGPSQAQQVPAISQVTIDRIATQTSPALTTITTFIPTPTVMPSSTPTFIPEPTASPTITITPTPLFVSLENAAQLVLLDKLRGFEGVSNVIFSPAGVAGVRISEDGTLNQKLIQPQVLLNDNGEENWMLGSPELSVNGKLYASQPKDSSGYWVSVWELADNLSLLNKISDLSGYSTGKIAVRFSDDGEYLFSVIAAKETVIVTPNCAPQCENTYGPTYGNIYKLPEGNLVSGVKINSLGVRYHSSEFSPDNTYLATILMPPVTSKPQLYFQLWQVSDGSLYRKLDAMRSKYLEGENASLVFSPDGKLLALIGGGNLQTWEWEINNILWTVEGIFSALDYSPYGGLLATGSPDGSIQLWNAGDGSELVTLTGHEHAITYVAFSPDGSFLASLDEMGYLILWSVPPSH